MIVCVTSVATKPFHRVVSTDDVRATFECDQVVKIDKLSPHPVFVGQDFDHNRFCRGCFAPNRAVFKRG